MTTAVVPSLLVLWALVPVRWLPHSQPESAGAWEEASLARPHGRLTGGGCMYLPSCVQYVQYTSMEVNDSLLLVGILWQYWGGREQSHTHTCMCVLQVCTNID